MKIKSTYLISTLVLGLLPGCIEPAPNARRWQQPPPPPPPPVVYYQAPPPPPQPEVVVMVDQPPPLPPPQAEIIMAQPGPDFLWIGGAWSWNARQGRYVWAGGRWERPPHRGARWNGPHWERRGGGNVFIEGSWR